MKFIPKFEKTFHFYSTNAYEVHTAITQLAPKTSAGYDLLSTKLIRAVAAQIADPLAHVINVSFNAGVVPDELKLAKVVPIFKGGDKNQLINFRPISICLPFQKYTSD